MLARDVLPQAGSGLPHIAFDIMSLHVVPAPQITVYVYLLSRIPYFLRVYALTLCAFTVDALR